MKHNFNAGPSILPKEVFEEASQAILNFSDTGLSILEIGHRTPLFQSVMDEAIGLTKELMRLDDDHEVLFLHGGATTQFFQVPMNLLNENETAAYLDCGVWGTKAIKEAKLFGQVNVVASSKDKNYTYIPKGYPIPADAEYFHYTTNNTIEGTEMLEIPETNVPLIADMSSDILSHEMDFNRFALIYAGAQKNIGAAGVNMVVLRKDILGKVNRKLPGMMDYRQHIEAGSMLNTPPVFAIYVCLLTLRWLKKQGGVAGIEKINKEKADLLYNAGSKIRFRASGRQRRPQPHERRIPHPRSGTGKEIPGCLSTAGNGWRKRPPQCWRIPGFTLQRAAFGKCESINHPDQRIIIMAIISPFRALRPQPALASKVASLPYDVLNSAEARIAAGDNPYSFLHITKAEIDLPESTDIHSEKVYHKAEDNLFIFRDQKILFTDEKPCYYIYQLTMNGKSQTGLVSVSAVADYEKDIIKKHELTRPEKELDRINHMRITGAQTGNVFLAYKTNKNLSDLISDWKQAHAARLRFYCGRRDRPRDLGGGCTGNHSGNHRHI